jgi:diguanylate cyclase (GGDEF)-like protein
MLNTIKYSRIASFLVLGFVLFLILFSISWALTSRHLEQQMLLNESLWSSIKKLRVISRLSETSRYRTQLSHSMLLTGDSVEKEAISVKISSLAGEFIQNHNELISLEPSSQEKVIIDSLVPLYPQVIDDLETVSRLASEGTLQTEERARNIITRQIVPTQERIIDGLSLLLHTIEEQADANSQALADAFNKYQQLRFILLVSILILSITIVSIVAIKAIKIENSLRALSRTDELTGVLNRQSFNTMVQDAWKSALRTKTPVTAILIDIDYFKKFNDFYGHQEGDRCLFKVANIIKSVVSRAGDIVARYGGQAFAVVLPNVDESGAKIVAERLLNQVRKENIPHVGSESERQQLTVSIGYTSMIPTQDNTPEKLIEAADDGLNESKVSGKDKASLVKYGKVGLDQK